MRRVGRAAETVDGQFAGPHLRVDAEYHLHRLREVRFEVEFAGGAVFVFAQRPQRVLDARRNATNRAENVPEKHQQPFAGAVQTGGGQFVGVEAEPGGQGQRPDAGDLLRRRGRQELAQLFDDGRVQAQLDEPVEQLLQPPPAARLQPRRRLEGVARLGRPSLPQT